MCGLEAEVRVFNLFAGSIPQEGLSRMERGRKVQSIVPDMRISIPEEGNFVPRLHELKIISSSKTRYTPHRQGAHPQKHTEEKGHMRVLAECRSACANGELPPL